MNIIVLKETEIIKITNPDYFPIVGQRVIIGNDFYFIKEIRYQLDVSGQNASVTQIIEIEKC